MSQMSAGRSVVILFFAGCPSAIFRLVISVVVDAVNGLSRQRLSHIGKEIFKTVVPAITDRNASATVPGPVFIIAVPTSLSQSKPAVMDLCSGLAVGAIARRLFNY